MLRFKITILKGFVNMEIKYSENTIKVMKEFVSKDIRHDHYESGEPLFGFSAFLLIDSDDNSDIEFNIMESILDIKNMDIPPSHINIYNNSHIFDGKTYLHLTWETKWNQVVDNKRDYLLLTLEFIDYIDNCPIEGLVFNTGDFYNDPDTVVIN